MSFLCFGKSRQCSESDEVPEKYSDPPRFSSVDYMRRRVDDKIAKNAKLGFRYRWLHLTTSASAMIMAATVPVLISMDYKLWPTLLSLGVTILVGLESLFHFREHWRNYDLSKCRLREERWLYMTRSDEYAELDESKALQKFVKAIEEEIARERSETIGLRTVTRKAKE